MAKRVRSRPPAPSAPSAHSTPAPALVATPASPPPAPGGAQIPFVSSVAEDEEHEDLAIEFAEWYARVQGHPRPAAALADHLSDPLPVPATTAEVLHRAAHRDYAIQSMPHGPMANAGVEAAKKAVLSAGQIMPASLSSHDPRGPLFNMHLVEVRRPRPPAPWPPPPAPPAPPARCRRRPLPPPPAPAAAAARARLRSLARRTLPPVPQHPPRYFNPNLSRDLKLASVLTRVGLAFTRPDFCVPFEHDGTSYELLRGSGKAVRMQCLREAHPATVQRLRSLPANPHRPGDFAAMQQLYDAGFEVCPISGMPVVDAEICGPEVCAALWRVQCTVAVDPSRIRDALRAVDALRSALERRAVVRRGQ